MVWDCMDFQAFSFAVGSGSLVGMLRVPAFGVARVMRPVYGRVIVRKFQSSNKAAVLLSDAIEPFINGKTLGRAFLIGVTLIATARSYFRSKAEEEKRAIGLESAYSRTTSELFFSLPLSYFSTNGLLSSLSETPSEGVFSSSQKRSLHLLLLQTIRKHKNNTLTCEEASNIIDIVSPIRGEAAEGIQSDLAELLLLCVDKAGNDITDKDNLINQLSTLAIRPTKEELLSGSFSSQSNQPIAAALSKLIANDKMAAQQLLEDQGMFLLSTLSQSRIGDHSYFDILLPILGDAMNNKETVESFVNEGLILFLTNAINQDDSLKDKSALSNVTNVKLAKIHEAVDLERVSATQRILFEVSRCLGNISYNEPSVIDEIMSQGALNLLRTISANSRSSHTMLYLARALVNLSCSEASKEEIIQKGWVGELGHWISSQCQRGITYQTKMSGGLVQSKKTLLAGYSADLEEEIKSRKLTAVSLAALGNLASTNNRVASNIAKSSILRETTDYLRKTNNPNISVCKQFSRTLAILAHHEDTFTNKRIQTQVGLDGFLALLQNNDEAVLFNVARCLGSLVKEGTFARAVEYQDPNGMKLLHLLSQSSSLPVQRQVARCVANLAASTGGSKLAEEKSFMKILETWAKSKDDALSEMATRALASLLGRKVSGAKFAEGTLLLYPKLSSDQFMEDTAEFDIVLIHGVGGDPLTTWRSGQSNSVIWPRDWIPGEFPNVRIISIGYSMPVSKWSGDDPLPIKDQALIVLKHLKLARVGERPILFVTHSFGGLLVKQILQFSEEEARFGKIMKETKGIVFFSTPHRGADIAAYADKILFRGTSAIDVLNPKSEHLANLHSEFEASSSHIPTLSFGENSNTCISQSQYTCFQLVSDESANPRFNNGATHTFVKLDANHHETCKPKRPKSIAYQAVVAFIKQSIKKEEEPL